MKGQGLTSIIFCFLLLGSTWNNAEASLLGDVLFFGAVGGTVLIAGPFALAAVGFGSGGIAAGSIGAGMMSSAALANGGGIAAGSFVATCQSVGAVGISAATSASIAGVATATKKVFDN